MMKKLIHGALALAVVTAAGIASADDAEAHRWRRGYGIVAGTVIGLGFLGAASYAYSRPYYYSGGCYKGPLQCRWVGGGCWTNHRGREVCRRGYESCWRPTYCN